MEAVNKTLAVTSLGERIFEAIQLQAYDMLATTGVLDKITPASLKSEDIPETVVIAFNIALVAISLYALLKTWQFLFCPMDLFHDITEIGFVHHDKKFPKLKAINMMRRQRKCGGIPPVYPNGWFRLLDSRMLDRGQLKSVNALGENFAVFRNKDGNVRVLDAYCSHMGANMAAGGRVIGGDCLQCPFHGWIFSGETGKCIDIPYTKSIPKSASVRKWPVCEVNGIIYVWYHCDNTEPGWTIPELSQIGNLKYVGRTEHIVNAHIQDIPENAADVAHLGHLHKPIVGRDVENTYDSVWSVLRHDIKASWKANSDPDHPESATMQIRDDTHLLLGSKRLPIKTFLFDIEQIGPGNVHIHMNTPYFRGLFVQTITPIEPLVQRLTHSLYIDTRVPMVMAKIFFHLEATQIERDIMVWNNKTYLRAPLLVKEESTIQQHRRWYKQFYSENSPILNSSGTAVRNPIKTDVGDW